MASGADIVEDDQAILCEGECGKAGNVICSTVREERPIYIHQLLQYCNSDALFFYSPHLPLRHSSPAFALPACPAPRHRHRPHNISK